MAVGADSKGASGWTLEDYAPVPNYVVQSYMFKRERPLDNSFINLCVQDHRHLRRSKSVPSFMKAPHHEFALDDTGAGISSVDEASKEYANRASAVSKEDTLQNFTTVIIRNLPVDADQAGVQSALNDAGFVGTYDYLYVPVRFGDGSCHGYGFINFVSHQMAVVFMQVWQGSKIFCGARHRKPLDADVASSQGIVALMKQRRYVRNPKFRPYIACASRKVR